MKRSFFPETPDLRRVSRGVASSVLEGAIGFYRLFSKDLGLRILYYHRIDRGGEDVSCVSPERFASQMDYLAHRGYRVMPLDEVPDYLRTGKAFPEKSVVLTFDDGFKDNHTFAYPVLARHGFPATIFLVAGFIGGEELPVFTRRRERCQPLSWNDVTEMARHGISFGAHSLTHPELTRLTENEILHEVAGSKRLIEERLGNEVKFFCYPRGDFDERSRAIVAAAGFSGACTTRPGATRPGSDPFSLHRVYVGRDDTLGDFRKKLNGAYDFLHRGRQLWLEATQRGVGIVDHGN